MNPAIKLIRNKSELEGSAYFELLPGSFKGTHWNDGSVFLDEEVFCLIEKPFAECISGYDHYAFMEVDSGHWAGILQALRRLRDRVLHAKSIDDIQAYVCFSWRDTRVRFAKNFNQNRQDLITLIDDLVQWVSGELKRESNIAVLGM